MVRLKYLMCSSGSLVSSFFEIDGRFDPVGSWYSHMLLTNGELSNLKTRPPLAFLIRFLWQLSCTDYVGWRMCDIVYSPNILCKV